jgi:myo-inositol-1-phosphate synthase
MKIKHNVPHLEKSKHLDVEDIKAVKSYNVLKRINRKKIIEVLETSRMGYSTMVLKAREIDDKIMESSCKAHHQMLNKQIVELGGESVDAPLLDVELK